MTDSKTTAMPGKANWSDQKTKLKAKFTTLTDTDLQYEDGKKDEMMTRIQQKLGKSKEELATIISTL
jgi:uncharacterized protein YjbJ (UPF0337 family)